MAEIDEALDAADSLLAFTRAATGAPRIAEARAERAGALSEAEERAHHLREAHRLYTEMGATGHAERVARELKEIGEDLSSVD